MKEDNYPRILLISDAAWADNNNIGNTFTNLFKGWPRDKLAMIYARPNLPNTEVCNNFFQISEVRLIKRIVDKRIKVGKKIDLSKKDTLHNQNAIIKKEEKKGNKLYHIFLKYRFNLFLSAREVLWKIVNWKTQELDDFIMEFNPQIVLSLADSSVYMNRIQQYVADVSRAKSIIYFVDDVYLTKRFSISPIFWINKNFIRKNIRKTVELCDLVFTIIQKQKEEYDNYFNINSKIINKGGEFLGESPPKARMNTPLKFVYTGNITSGRWETLVKIGKTLDKINENGTKAILNIYSQNHLYRKINEAFKNIKSINFMGSIPSTEVKEIQENADVLIHVESLKLKEKLQTRLSFSTKLVDYFERGKCILAVGWSEAASIDYLKKNNAAIVIDENDKIEEILDDLINNPILIKDCGDQAWEFGKKNHSIDKIQKELYEDLKSLVKEDKNDSITD